MFASWFVADGPGGRQQNTVVVENDLSLVPDVPIFGCITLWSAKHLLSSMFQQKRFTKTNNHLVKMLLLLLLIFFAVIVIIVVVVFCFTGPVRQESSASAGQPSEVN
jgi:uncharacterized membrane protein